jgi:pyruvate/2-oxoglutarate dehydrogenase complex dihydrolipoamide acyltransferase (E2) component
MTPVEMPKANENLIEATLDRWLVKEGDSVRQDQALCDIITDKAKFEMPSPASGVILKLLGPERALLPVGYVMCVIGAAGEQVPGDLAAKNEALLAAHRSAATSFGGATTQPNAAGAPADLGGTAVRATPAARRIAKENTVDLAAVAKAYNLTAPVGEKDVRRFIDENPR